MRGDRGPDQVAQAISGKSGMGSAGGPVATCLPVRRPARGQLPRTRFSVDLRDGTTTAELRLDRPAGRSAATRSTACRQRALDLPGRRRPTGCWTITGGELQAVTYGGDDWVSVDLDDTINAGDGTDTVHGNGGKDVCKRAEHGTC